MIAKFIASRFSGYIAIAGVVAVLGLVYYIYNEGKQACVNNVITSAVSANIDSREGAIDVQKKEQSLDSIKLDDGLCKLGIVRENRGCE